MQIVSNTYKIQLQISNMLNKQKNFPWPNCDQKGISFKHQWFSNKHYACLLTAGFMAGAAGIEPATYGFEERTGQYNQTQLFLVNSVYLQIKRELFPINSNC